VLAQAIRKPPRVIRDNVLFLEPVDDVESVFFVRHLDTRDGTMSKVVITQFQQGRVSRVIEAERARYGPEGWVLEDGKLYLLGSPGGVATTFGQMRVALKRKPPDIAPPTRDPAEMTIQELRAEIARLQAVGGSIIRYALNLQLKLALPVSSVIFALLAVPLGLRPHRSGRSTGLGLTVLVILAYYVLMSITVTLGERGQLSPVWAAWFPNLTVACTGLYLLWTAR
jgi:lipopolysaccharide export system permease protein